MTELEVSLGHGMEKRQKTGGGNAGWRRLVLGGGGGRGRGGERQAVGRSVCSFAGGRSAAAAAAGAGQWTLSVTAPNERMDVSSTLEHKVWLTARVLLLK